MDKNQHKSLIPHMQRYLITGALTIIPIWVTWLVFDFVLTRLSNLGRPSVIVLSKALQSNLPVLARWLLEPWFQSALAVILTILALYLLGLAATLVVGKRLIALFESIMARLPLIQTIYGATKKLLSALQTKPDGIQRVVLIDFPSTKMKAIGFVTRLMRDEASGEELAAVYVPTTPNPTSGYMEIVPIKHIISTNWSMDEAMTFILTGGMVAPDNIHYSENAPDRLDHEATR